MKRYLVSLFAGALLTQLPAQTPSGEAAPQKLNPVQADAIVAAEEAAKESKRQAQAPDFRTVEQRTVDLGDRTLTLREVAPPNLPPRVVAPKPQLSAAEHQAEIKRLVATKMINLVATVYDRQVTHLRWQHDGQVFTAWSTADFNYLRTTPEFSVDGQNYLVSMFITNKSIADLQSRRLLALHKGYDLKIPEIPDLPEPSDSLSVYYVETNDPDLLNSPEAFVGIDAAHQHLDANLESLKTALANQEALNAARKRHEAANPKSKDKTLTYWIEE